MNSKSLIFSGYGYSAYGAYAGYPYTYGAHYIGKRSADAEPKAEAQYYGTYGLGEWIYSAITFLILGPLSLDHKYFPILQVFSNLPKN